MKTYIIKDWAYKTGGNFCYSVTEEDRKNRVFRAEAAIVRETEKAVLLHGLGEGNDTWFPKSAIVEEVA
jgi:hypothetical protein